MKNARAIGIYIKACRNALVQTKFFLDLKSFSKRSENNWDKEPRVCGREPNKPNWILFARKNTAKAERNDSPKPSIAE